MTPEPVREWAGLVVPPGKITEGRRSWASTELAPVTLEAVLEAGSRLVAKIAAVAGAYARYLGAIRRGGFEEDEGWLFSNRNLATLVRLHTAEPGDLTTLVSRARAGGMQPKMIARGLLGWSEAVGFEDPESGRKLAEAAQAAAGDAPEDVQAKARLALASWRRALGLGSSGELFGTVMSGSAGLSESLVGELSRRYSYLLADGAEPAGAVFAAWNAVRASRSLSAHDRGLADLAMGYACIRTGSMPDALRWFGFALPNLDPVGGFPESFQAAINTLHFAADFAAGTDLSAAGTLGDRLSECSPFGAGTAPAVHLEWACQRLRVRSSKSARPEASPWTRLAGAPYFTLLT